jgi:hypothetical protein
VYTLNDGTRIKVDKIVLNNTLDDVVMFNLERDVPADPDCDSLYDNSEAGEGSVRVTPRDGSTSKSDLPRFVLSARATPYVWGYEDFAPDRFVLTSLGFGVRAGPVYIIPRIGYAHGGSDTADPVRDIIPPNPADPLSLETHRITTTTDKSHIWAPELELRFANQAGYLGLTAGAWRLKTRTKTDRKTELYLPGNVLVDEQERPSVTEKDAYWLGTAGAGFGIFLGKHVTLGLSINGVSDLDDKHGLSGSVDLSGYF